MSVEPGSSAAAWPSRALLLRRGEFAGLAWAFAYFFCLLCSYYMLRPVRDEMGVRGGVENLQWLFTGTFVAMLAAVPAFGALVARFPRRRLLPLVYLVFIACILAFFGWLQSGVAPDWAARAFFVWLSVFNLFVVSVFWSFMADIFDDEQATRLFGAIAAGGSAGAIVGPAVTAGLAAQTGPAPLLPISAAVLALTLPCILGLARWSRLRKTTARRREDADAAIGGGIFEGVRAVAASGYLIGICVFVWLYTTLATFLYFQQAEIVRDAFSDSGERTSVFAGIDLAANALTVGIQLFVTARIVGWIGLPRTLALVPGIVCAGFLLLAAAPSLLAIMAVQVIRRAGNYGLARPGREMLFTPVSRMEKYKAKNFIDTVVYRGGDAVSGWVYAGLSALGLGLRGLALVAVPLALLWLAAGYRLGRRRQRLVQDAAEEA